MFRSVSVKTGTFEIFCVISGQCIPLPVAMSSPILLWIARVRLEELERLKNRSKLTYLIDGWEDILKRSLYGSVAAGVGQYPTILALDDMTGNRATAEGIMNATERAMRDMDLLDGMKFIAITTDNPTVMQAMRKKFQAKYFWVLVSTIFSSRR